MDTKKNTHNVFFALSMCFKLEQNWDIKVVSELNLYFIVFFFQFLFWNIADTGIYKDSIEWSHVSFTQFP